MREISRLKQKHGESITQYTRRTRQLADAYKGIPDYLDFLAKTFASGLRDMDIQLCMVVSGALDASRQSRVDKAISFARRLDPAITGDFDRLATALQEQYQSEEQSEGESLLKILRLKQERGESIAQYTRRIID